MQHALILIFSLRKILVLSLLFAFINFTLSCQKQTATSFNTTDKVSQIKEVPKDWRKIETDYFSFSIPPTMKKKNVRGIDSFVMEFEDNEFTLSIEYGDYSQDVSSLLQNYEGEKEQVIIDGEKTELFSYDLTKPINSTGKTADAANSANSANFEKVKKPLKSYVGINFPHKNEVIAPEDRPATSFVVKSKTLEAKETAKMIFSSIKFKD